MDKITVLLVDDHNMVRSGLRVLLESKGIEIIGEARDGRAALEMIKQSTPDVVVMDLRLPELNGIDATRQALLAKPGLKVIGLSANTDERSATEMLRAGAVGYVAKDAAYEELVEAIRTVHKGKVYFSPSVVEHFSELTRRSLRDGGNTAFDVLTSREREVLQMVAEGQATKEIAHHLNVSLKTAETHKRNLMEKLHVYSIAELTKYAVREGISGP